MRAPLADPDGDDQMVGAPVKRFRVLQSRVVQSWRLSAILSQAAEAPREPPAWEGPVLDEEAQRAAGSAARLREADYRRRGSRCRAGLAVLVGCDTPEMMRAASELIGLPSLGEEGCSALPVRCAARLLRASSLVLHRQSVLPRLMDLQQSASHALYAALLTLLKQHARAVVDKLMLAALEPGQGADGGSGGDPQPHLKGAAAGAAPPCWAPSWRARTGALALD